MGGGLALVTSLFTSVLNCTCRSCQVAEEKEDSDDDQPSYRKTYKLQ